MFEDWSSWIREGYYLSYKLDGTRYYEYVLAKDLAHYVFPWPSAIPSLTASGPLTPQDIEITSQYSEDKNTNQLWQMIFGIKRQCLIYVELPTDTHRHGIPKVQKPSATNRMVSSFEEYMSPFMSPSFITEHLLLRPETMMINFEAYNPTNVTLTPELNIFLNKLLLERVGTEIDGELYTPTIPDKTPLTKKLNAKWGETLKKLYQGQIPSRPLSLTGVGGPAAAK